MGAGFTYYDKNGNQYQINPGSPLYALTDPFVGYSSPNKALPWPGNNSTSILLQARTENFSPTTLGTTTHIYSCVIPSDAQALAAYFVDWNCSYKLSEGPNYIIEVEIPFTTITNNEFTVSDFVSEQWEIIPNQNTKPLAVNGILVNPFSAPNATGNYVVLPDVLKIAVQQAYDNKYSFTLPATVTGSMVQFIPYAQTILNYMRGGVEGVPSYTQTLKRTAIVDVNNTNGAFQKTADFTRASLNEQGTINYILSTNDLINAYEVNSAPAQLLNPSYCKAITVTGLEPIQYYSFAGWMVTPPTSKFITPTKVQFEQTFLWDEWLEGIAYIYSNISSFPLTYNPSANPSGYMPPPPH